MVTIYATIKISASSFILRLLLVKVIEDGQRVLPIRKFLSVHPAIDAGCVNATAFADGLDESHGRCRIGVMLPKKLDY